MGVDIDLIDPEGKICSVKNCPNFGSIVAFSATTGEEVIGECSTSLTYNYSHLFGLVLPETGLYKFLDGKKAKDTIEELKLCVDKLAVGDPIRAYHRTRDDCEKCGHHMIAMEALKPENRIYDYWAPTPANAGFAAKMLLTWAEQNLDATWRCGF